LNRPGEPHKRTIARPATMIAMSSVDGSLVFRQFQQNEFAVFNLDDSRNGFLGVLRRLRLGVEHLLETAGDSVGAKSGLLVQIYEHNIDSDHDTHSLANTHGTQQLRFLGKRWQGRGRS
jgi:hypothetical protein